MTPEEAVSQLKETIRQVAETVAGTFRQAVAGQVARAAYTAWAESPETGAAYLEGLEESQVLEMAQFAAWLMGQSGRDLSRRIAERQNG
jgi:hypothetical protein